MILLTGVSGGEAALKYTRFEKARIIGARALQISAGAPILLEVPKEFVDPIKIAELEFSKSVIPITVRRDMEAT